MTGENTSIRRMRIALAKMAKLVGYEVNTSIAVLGPPRVGKTHFMIGLYDHIRQLEDSYRSQENLKEPLQMLYETEQWLTGHEIGDITHMRVEYVDGYGHTRTISMLDFPGQLFEYIPEALSNQNKNDLLNVIENKMSSSGGENVYRPNNHEDAGVQMTGDSHMAEQIANNLLGTNEDRQESVIGQIERADVVLLLVSVESIRDPATPAFTEYMVSYVDIVSEIEDKTVFIVGSKADRCADKMVYDPPEHYEAFQKELTRDFKKKFTLLGAENVNDSIFPVYIKENDDGYPSFGGPEVKNIQTFGFDKLLKAIEHKA